MNDDVTHEEEAAGLRHRLSQLGCMQGGNQILHALRDESS